MKIVDTRLYDVMKDPHEDHDLHSDPAHQDLLKRMTELLVTARHPDPEAKRPFDDVPMPAVEEKIKAGGLTASVYQGDWPWTPDFRALTPVSSEAVTGVSIPSDVKKLDLGLQFEGYMFAPADGEYLFDVHAFPGADLWVHDAHVIYSNQFEMGGKGESDRQAPPARVKLLKGWHPIRLAYIYWGRGQTRMAQLSLKVSINGAEAKELNADMLGTASPK